MKGQTRKASLVEAAANIAVGIGVAFVSQVVLFSAYGVHVPASLNVKLTLWFTAVSLARQFVLRRIFNAITCRWIRPDESSLQWHMRTGAPFNPRTTSTL